MKIIHLTDLHIVPRGKRVITLDPNKRLMRTIESINASHADADLCVLTGDLTDAGDVASYEQLSSMLDELSVPYRLMLGNHDNRKNFTEVFGPVPRDDNGYLQSVEAVGDVRLVFLDTLDDDDPAIGRLCHRRLQWLENKLAEAASNRVIIFMHHPPRGVGVAWFDQMLLANPESFLDVINRYPLVEHLAFGHLHLTTTGCWNRVSFSCNHGTCHRIELDLHAGCADYVESEPSYDVMLINNDGVVVHHVSLTTTSDLLAREHPTPDGRGRVEYFDERETPPNP